MEELSDMKDDEALFPSAESDGQSSPECFSYEGDELVRSEPSEVDFDPEDNSDRLANEISDQDVRPEVVDRVILVLRADAERMEGKLRREDVQRQCFRRDLTVGECIRVELLLSTNGIAIASEDDSESLDTGDAYGPNSHSSYSDNKLFLTDAEERELGRKIHLASRASVDPSQASSEYVQRLETEAIAAKKRFVESNILYVRKIAARYATTRHMTEEDIFQEGVIGLLRATDSYDPEMGFRFKTYATWWITQKIHRAIANCERTIRLPVHVTEKVRAAKRASRALMGTSGEEPSLDEIAETIGIETARLARIMWAVEESECIDGDAPVTDNVDDAGATLFSFLKDSQAVSQFDLAFRAQLELLIKDSLTEKQAEVLLQRFGFGDLGEQTLEQVGGRLGLTRERVRQIQDDALIKLGRVLNGMIVRKRKKS
jgi:RNA polymerase primary sigma factor